jgi:hypothetical protein
MQEKSPIPWSSDMTKIILGRLPARDFASTPKAKSKQHSRPKNDFNGIFILNLIIIITDSEISQYGKNEKKSHVDDEVIMGLTNLSSILANPSSKTNDAYTLN